jgi:prevent-host-death family protein
MKVSVQTAERQLAELIDTALSGEEVIFAKDGRPVAKLVPIQPKKFKIGLLAGQLGEVPDFFEPMSEEDLRLWEGGS